MSAPQLEDGYLRIANSLYDAILAYPFNSRTLKVVLSVIRKTYGYGKKEDDMSASQISELCGISRQHVTSALNELQHLNIISKRIGKYGSVVGINKNFDTWIARPKSVQVSQTGTDVPNQDMSQSGTPTSPESGHLLVPNRDTQKTTPKDNYQKTNAHALTARFEQFWLAYPKKKSKGQAEKTFAKINPDEQLLTAIIAGVRRARTSRDWRKDAGQYIPHASTWLNAKGWEDEADGETFAAVDPRAAAIQAERGGSSVVALNDGRYRQDGRIYDSYGKPEVAL